MRVNKGLPGALLTWGSRQFFTLSVSGVLKMSGSNQDQKPEPKRYVELGEHQKLEAQFKALVQHIEKIRFDGSSIELPENLKTVIAE
jgi:hypothetical protein